MGKYEPLTRHLNSLHIDSWDASFEQIEGVLGFALPRSAVAYPAWWANQEGGHSQTTGWRDAGWETCQLDLPARRVRFKRRLRRLDAVSDYRLPNPVRPLSDLWERAHRISGIADRDALIEAALTTFVRREAAKHLIALGGTMPDLTVPPRERPTW